MWIIFPQHIFGHHPFTNIDGVDPDISTAKEVIICYWNYHVLCFGFIVGVLIYGTSSFIRSQNGKINSILTSSRYLFKLFEGLQRLTAKGKPVSDDHSVRFEKMRVRRWSFSAILTAHTSSSCPRHYCSCW